MSLDPAEIATWQDWVGRTESNDEIIDVGSLRRFAAAIGDDLADGRRLPWLSHWASFLPVFAQGELGSDGHPARGGLLPPISLPRRMFAAAEIDFYSPLVSGELARRSSRIVSVTHKSGRTGDLVLVDVEHRISQSGSERLTERQTLVYRDVGDPTPAVIAVVLPDDSAAELWEPTSIDLFRFSAATFNSHRIHYDLPYASDVEGYPGLVVHGPFTASRLFGLLTRDRAPPRRFCFRALAPLFAGQPIRLVRTATGASAIRVDGVTAMNATAEF